MATGEVIDLEAIRPRTVTVRANVEGEGERVWRLSDQVPTELLLRVFDLYILDQRIAEAGTSIKTAEDGAAMRSLWQERFDLATAIVGDIFRCSYPETTDADVRRWLPVYADRRRIAEAFFSLPGATSSGSSSDSPSGANGSAPTPTTSPTRMNGTTTTTTGNRAMRRSQSRAKGMQTAH